MEGVLSLLNQPLFHGAAVSIWMIIAAGGGLLLVLISAFILIRRKKRGDKAAEEPITVPVNPPPELELANLQGIGSRYEQQDAFGISRMERYEKDGLFAVLCDGMGGMTEGGRIAEETVSELLGVFPLSDNDIPDRVSQQSAKVYRHFRGHGGTTMVAVLIKGNRLLFWCVGDSDLFLLRGNKLYGMNIRQEYKNELLLRALQGAFPVEEAFNDPQAGALSEYIGKEDVKCDYSRKPFFLHPGDALLLCSDGVSDTLTLKQIMEAMALSTQACCDKLEEDIISADKPNQDNYTAVVLNYHGKGEKE